MAYHESPRCALVRCGMERAMDIAFEDLPEQRRKLPCEVSGEVSGDDDEDLDDEDEDDEDDGEKEELLYDENE